MFDLPVSSIVNRVIPKNTFEKYINTRQKKQFSEFIDKIRWLNKLSPDTINLSGKDVVEIQIIEIYLKKQNEVEDLLNIIDRNIPYNIIFILKFENLTMFSASQKHPNPTIEDTTVVDWRFKSKWIKEELHPFKLILKQNLDEVFSDFCLQISGKKTTEKQDFKTLIIQEQKKKQLNSEISKLQSEIKNCKQFNKKVELNLLLQSKISQYNDI